ncbi:MmpS family transport accessory protein [Streptomyces sp. NPDC001922]|uniref:MmpS family transport accessory protein n=1 Tax=Streptomyces sp. NPDC001922 TaxID=3364624 RepID=UPI0036AC3435
MSWGHQQSPQPPYPQGHPQPAAPAPARPRWARKRIALPVAAGLLLFGVGIGSAGDDSTARAAAAGPAPTVTATVTARAAADPAGKQQPKPGKAPARSEAKAHQAEQKKTAPSGKAVFKVWGTAPSGADITYGSDTENLDGSGLPMTKTLTVKDDALYYQISAQLQGGGDIRCSVTIDGKTKSGRARGGYNICSAQLNGGLLGGWN